MAIQQHPVPQDISNYKFRLIGDMTIKQFASLGISIVLSIITYSMPLPFFFKYPLSFLLLALGVGMAFVPVQGRTLDVWIIAFIKSIYSPTQYVWKQVTDIQSVAPPVSAPTKSDIQNPATPIVNITPPTAILEAPIVTENTPLVAINTSPSTTAEVTPNTPTVEEKTNIEVAALPTETTTKDTVENKEIVENPTPVNIDPATPPAPLPDSSSLPIPFTPSTPNTLVGLSLTPDSHVLDGVLVEIKQEDLTIRATKSNKLGQFLFARPLENGLYQILAEKEGFTFTPYSIELKGEIIKPLKVQAEKN